MASVHWKREGRQGSRRRVAIPGAEGKTQRAAWAYGQGSPQSFHPLRRPLLKEVLILSARHAEHRAGLAGSRGLRLQAQPSLPAQSLGLRGPGCHLRRRCHRFCAAWATGSSTGLCCVRDGLACSQTGNCFR